MQQSKEKMAEPSMEDILASIRKIISEEPVAAQASDPARPAIAAATSVTDGGSPKSAAQSHRPATPSASPTRLSDIVRELAPTAVPVSSISTASFHDDMADLVDVAPTPVMPSFGGSTSVASPSATPPTFRPAQPEPTPMIERGPVTSATPLVGSKSTSTSNAMPSLAPAFSAPPAAISAPSASKSTSDFGAFIPSTAESIGMTSPRPAPISMGAEFRTVEPARVPTPSRASVAEPAAPTSTASAPTATALNGASIVAASTAPLDDAVVGDLERDPVAAAQSALGALAMGFAVSAPVAPAVSSDSGTGRKSLDDAIVEMLRPMLRDWLDSHLPEMVEKALRQEMSAHQDRLGG